MSQGTEFHGRAATPAHPGRHRRVGRRRAGRAVPHGAVLRQRGRPALRAAAPVPSGMRGRRGASGELRAIAHAGSTIRSCGPDAIRLGNDPIGASSRAEYCSESCANARARDSGRAGPVPPRVPRASPDPDARVLTTSTLGASGGESRPQTCKLQRFHSVGRDRTGDGDAAKRHAAPSPLIRSFSLPYGNGPAWIAALSSPPRRYRRRR